MSSLFAKLRLRRRAVTGDRDINQTPVLASEQIGEKRSLTPEGFLFCEDVPISRVGTMMYGPGEIPVTPGADGLCWVRRGEDELFKPEVIASFNGKPIVDEHPGPEHHGKVTPKNMTKLTKGWVLNPRRGNGHDNDVLLADLLITDAGMIRDVSAGKREVSAGYEADYVPTGTGRADQSAIIGNHVALVEKGRCGPRCAIGDHFPSIQQEQPMATSQPQARTVTISRRPPTRPAAARTPMSVAVRQIFQDAEAAALEAMGEGGSNGTEVVPADDGMGGGSDAGNGDIHIHLSDGGAQTTDEVPDGGAPAAGGDLESRVGALEEGVGKILQILQAGQGAPAAAAPAAPTPPAAKPTGDEAPSNADVTPADDDTKGKMTGDSAALETGFKEMLAAAEILLPGVALPIFDAKVVRATTVDSMCGFRRRVLDGVMLTTDGKALVTGLTADGTLDLAKASCNEIAVLFKGAAAARGGANNRAAVGDARLSIPAAPTPPAKSSRPQTIAELNAWNRKYHAGK